MKKNYTLLFSLILLATVWLGSISAQTTWNVQVDNFSFTPANLTIQQGDIVVWTNIQGTHNVNGTISRFPNNPASFGNDVAPATWEYSFTFDVAGDYDYLCDPHASFMTGSITVTPSTSINQLEDNSEDISIYPMPFRDKLTFEFSDALNNTYKRLDIFSLTGIKVYSNSLDNTEVLELNLSHLTSSVYIYQLTGTSGKVVTGKIVKE